MYILRVHAYFLFGIATVQFAAFSYCVSNGMGEVDTPAIVDLSTILMLTIFFGIVVSRDSSIVVEAVLASLASGLVMFSAVAATTAIHTIPTFASIIFTLVGMIVILIVAYATMTEGEKKLRKGLCFLCMMFPPVSISLALSNQEAFYLLLSIVPMVWINFFPHTLVKKSNGTHALA